MTLRSHEDWVAPNGACERYSARLLPIGASSAPISSGQGGRSGSLLPVNDDRLCRTQCPRSTCPHWFLLDNVGLQCCTTSERFTVAPLHATRHVYAPLASARVSSSTVCTPA